MESSAGDSSVTITETSNSVNSSSQLATNKQELGKTLDKASPTLASPKEKKSEGLLPKTPREKENHALQPGDAGYVKQEIRNREIKDRNAKLEEQAFKDFKEKSLKNRAAKQVIADRTNVKVKKDGSDETS